MTAVLSIAENTHDSCISLSVGGNVLCHLEAERFLRSKRHRFRDLKQLESLVDIVLSAYGVSPPVQLVISRHKAESLYEGVRRKLAPALGGLPVFSLEHFECHAGLAFLSGFDNAVVVVVDGGGDRLVGVNEANASVFFKAGESLSRLGPLFAEGSMAVEGRAWAVASLAQFGDIHAAGKLMGLAGYGASSESALARVSDALPKLLSWRYDEETLVELTRLLAPKGKQDAADLAAALQATFEASLLEALAPLASLSRNLVLVGGCALNVLANTAITESGLFEHVYVPPCPGDEGQSLGALLYFHHAEMGPAITTGFPFLGLGTETAAPHGETIAELAEHLSRGSILVMHRGRAEAGPRALGHRSLLGLPSLDNKRRMSVEIKGREPFRPVAPCFPAEAAGSLLERPIMSAYMTFSGRASRRLKEEAPGVVHVDGTCRHQTVSVDSDPLLHHLLVEVGRIAGTPVLINTSLNTAGMPMTDTASDSLRLWATSAVDVAYVDGAIFARKS